MTERETAELGHKIIRELLYTMSVSDILDNILGYEREITNAQAQEALEFACQAIQEAVPSGQYDNAR